MKRNISDLLDRYPAEDVELGGNTPYSPTRIKEITMKNIHTETKSRKRGFKPARLLVAAAVAAAFTVSALAAGRLLGGELFGDVFSRGNDSLTPGQMETIDRLVQTFEGQDGAAPAAVTDNGASITPLAALADENVYYLRLRVEAPEGTALPDLDWERDGACYQLFGPEADDHLTLEPAEGAYPADTFGYQLNFRPLPDSEPNDNVKEFVARFTNLSDGGIALNDGVSKVFTVRGLWTQDSDKGYTPIFTGTFAFDIGLNFQSQLAELEAGGLTWSTRAEDELRGAVYDVTNTVEQMSLSPLSLSYRYTTTLPADNNWIGAGLGPVEIVLTDGTSIPCIHGRDTDVGNSQAGTRELEGFAVFDQPLDLSKVDHLQYGDNKIPVNAG
ncbi:MAG: hypothetical protein HFF51_01305 [Lawsonibacter sp.]|nr:hypothetical protein [Lawsonibacter sp.]